MLITLWFSNAWKQSIIFEETRYSMQGGNKFWWEKWKHCSVEPFKRDTLQDRLIDSWRNRHLTGKFKCSGDYGRIGSYKYECGLLEQTKDHTLSCKLGNNHTLRLSMKQTCLQTKIKSIISRVVHKLDVSVLRGNLQWQLLLETAESICFIEVSFLQVSV